MLAVILGVAGCQLTSRSTAIDSPTFVAGRLAITGFSLNPSFSLEQITSDQQRLTFSGAFGLGRVDMIFTRGQAVEGIVDGETLSEEALATKLYEATGLSLPLAGLPDWIMGRPFSGVPHQVIPNGFEQLDWRFQGFEDPVRGHPTKILAELGELGVVLGIRSWR